MFMHKGKKGPGELEEENKLEGQAGDIFCNCDPECKAAYDKVCADLAICQQELTKGKESLLRVSADLQNFQRRVEKEKIQWINISQSELLHGFLAVVDDFDRALQESEKKDLSQDAKIFVDGFSMTYKTLCKFLEDKGLIEIKDVSKFDPNLHEAISQIDSPDNESGAIILVAQKGYMFKSQVLRPAKVIVAR